MGTRTRIPWTAGGWTWNIMRGCLPRGKGCLNCYATRQAIRGAYPGGPYEGLVESTPRGPQWTGAVAFNVDALGDPVRWTEPSFVFVNSMSDLFYQPFTDEQIAAVVGAMMLAPLHVYQCLTKRERRALAYFEDVTPAGCIASARAHGLQLTPRQAARFFALLPEGHLLRPLFRPGGVASCDLPFNAQHRAELAALRWPMPHIWLGASVNDQESFDDVVGAVRGFTAAVRFLSLEPLTGPIVVGDKLRPRRAGDGPIAWMILGGESGPRARRCDVSWISDLVRELRTAGLDEAAVATFVKQIGARPFVMPAEAVALDPCADAISLSPDPGERKVRLTLLDRKGENPAEWPDDLLVQEYPRGVYLPAAMEAP